MNQFLLAGVSTRLRRVLIIEISADLSRGKALKNEHRQHKSAEAVIAASAVGEGESRDCCRCLNAPLFEVSYMRPG